MKKINLYIIHSFSQSEGIIFSNLEKTFDLLDKDKKKKNIFTSIYIFKLYVKHRMIK